MIFNDIYINPFVYVHIFTFSYIYIYSIWIYYRQMNTSLWNTTVFHG